MAKVPVKPTIREVIQRASPRLCKWLLFDLLCGLAPLVLHAFVHALKAKKALTFTEIVSDGELALVAAVLMASCAGELYLMETQTNGLKIARLICGFACGATCIFSSLYFSFVKAGLVSPDYSLANCFLFSVTVLAGALMTTMGEA